MHTTCELRLFEMPAFLGIGINYRSLIVGFGLGYIRLKWGTY